MSPTLAQVVLEVRNLSVSYGGVQALDDVSIKVESGSLVGLIGPNGAGKTTLIDAITGFTDAIGSLTFNGRNLKGLRPSQRTHLGLCRTFQGGELFDDLTVRENLIVGARTNSLGRMIRDLFRPAESIDEQRVTDALRLVGLEGFESYSPSQLSQGQLKLAAVARALTSRPYMLLLDEPAAGLDSSESRAFGTRLRQLADEGLSVLLVDHDIGLVLSICDWIYVLDFGRIIAEGSPNELRSNSIVLTAYLGSAEMGTVTRDLGQ